MLGRGTVFVNFKYDGNRVFAFNNDGRYVMASRHNGVYQAATYPDIFKDLRFPTHTTLDGELVEKENYVVFFDILMHDHRDLTSDSLQTRLLMLTGALHQLTDHVRIAPAYPVDSEEEILKVYDKALVQGYEGVVVKDPAAIYGAQGSWWKKKHYVTDDLVVMQGHATESSIRTGHFVSWELGAFDEKGVLVHVVDAYANKLEARSTKVGDVVEVRHQPTAGFSKLRHPTILRIRTDKLPKECLLSQVQIVRGEQ